MRSVEKKWEEKEHINTKSEEKKRFIRVIDLQLGYLIAWPLISRTIIHFQQSSHVNWQPIYFMCIFVYLLLVSIFVINS